MKKYYVYSISIAILLPLLLGGFYFFDQYNINQKKIKDKNYIPEIIYIDKNSIDNIDNVKLKDSNYNLGNYFLFEIKNDSKYSKKYSIYLDNIKINNSKYNNIINWKLYMIDKYDTDSILIKSGTLKNITDDYLSITNNLKINSKEIHKYKLYYFLGYDENDKNDYSNLKFEAEIEVK